MPLYIADRIQLGLTLQQVLTVQRLAVEMSQRFTAAGRPVRYVRTTFVPSESHCMSLFEAPNAKVVQELNEAAQLPFTRIVEALDVLP